jgi:hypothetical protein
MKEVTRVKGNRQMERKLAVNPGEIAMALEVNDAAPVELESAVDEALAMQLISIRLPKRLIDDLKLIANKEGLGYQPLMRRVLVRFVSAELRAMARAELGEEQAPSAVLPVDCEDEPRLVAACR